MLGSPALFLSLKGSIPDRHHEVHEVQHASPALRGRGALRGLGQLAQCFKASGELLSLLVEGSKIQG